MTTHGGYRPPERPAAVSGPGRLGQRTDGGPGSQKQPIRVPSGGKYGEAQALRDQQQSAPMAAGNTPQMPGGGGGMPPPDMGMFGPSQRPNEPITAGAQLPGQVPDADSILRALYMKYPSPWIGALLHRG